MIQMQTVLKSADNTGAKTALCVKILGGSTARGQYTRRTAAVGDVIVVAIKKPYPPLPSTTKRYTAALSFAPSIPHADRMEAMCVLTVTRVC